MTALDENMPDVSVVMSVYGNWEDLPATMDSILGQDLDNIEIVLIDDGNPPEGRAVIEQVCARDARIRLITNESNIGLTKSLIKGCEAASADFIARIDCGDLMVPNDRLRLQHELMMQDSQVGLVCGGIELWDLVNQKRWRSRLKTKEHEEFLAQPEFETWADHPTVMMRKSAYLEAGGYSPEMQVGQDTELWPRIARHARLKRVARVFAIRTLSAESISVSRNSEQIKKKIHVMNRILRSRSDANRFSGRFQQMRLLLKEYSKLLLPIRWRMELRHRRAMEFVERIDDPGEEPLAFISGRLNDSC